jgi:hypothetical protein
MFTVSRSFDSNFMSRKKTKEKNITSASEVIDLIEILKHSRMIEPRTLTEVRITGTVSWLRYASVGDSCAESWFKHLDFGPSAPVTRWVFIESSATAILRPTIPLCRTMRQ